jgi:hypothetical protein
MTVRVERRLITTNQGSEKAHCAVGGRRYPGWRGCVQRSVELHWPVQVFAGSGAHNRISRPSKAHCRSDEPARGQEIVAAYTAESKSAGCLTSFASGPTGIAAPDKTVGADTYARKVLRNWAADPATTAHDGSGASVDSPPAGLTVK